jgi:hypothetical protein
MDITAVNDNWGIQDEWSEEWGNDWGNGGYGNIDALGKSKGKGFKGKGKGDNTGKGKGKPSIFNGQCYSCGEYGDSAKFCPLATGKAKGKGTVQTMCYNCGNAGHIPATCPKGKGKGMAISWGNPGEGNAPAWNGQWNIGAVQSSTVAISNQTDSNQADNSSPMWDNSNLQNDADFGGNWDATSGQVSRDDQWTVVARRARGNGDMRPIRFGGDCCARGGHLNSIERAANQVTCINEVTGNRGIFEKITVTVDSGVVDSVGPPTMPMDVKIRDTPASRAGLK